MKQRVLYLVLLLFAFLMVASEQSSNQGRHHDIPTCQSSDVRNDITFDIVSENQFKFHNTVQKHTPTYQINNSLVERSSKTTAVHSQVHRLNTIFAKPPKWKPFQINLYEPSGSDEDHHLFS
jgi:hypothetical protein